MSQLFKTTPLYTHTHTHTVLCETRLCTDLCGLTFFFFFSKRHRKWMNVCYSVSPPEPTGKMVSKESHQVPSLYLDIPLGNSNRAITTSSQASSSIYSCWIFLGLLRLFIVNTVVCVVPRAGPLLPPWKWYAYHIKLEQSSMKTGRCKQYVIGLGLPCC